MDKRTWEKLVDYPSLRPDLPIFSARYPPLSMTPPLGFRLPMVPLAASDPWRRDHGHSDRPSRAAPDPRDLYDGRTDFGSDRRESFPPARYDARDDGSRRREYRGDDDDGPRRDSHLTASARPNDDRYDQYRRRDLDDPSRGPGRYDRRDLDDRYERRDLDDRYERRDLDDRYERRDLGDRYERRDLDDRYERRDLDDPMWGSDRRGVAAETRPDYSRRMPPPPAGPPLDLSRSEVARYVDPDRPAPHSLLPAPPPPRDYHRRQGSRSYPPPPPPPPDPARVHDERPSDQPGGSPTYKPGEPSAQPPSSKRARTERRSVARHWPPSAEDLDRAEAPAASAQTQLAADDGGDDMDLEAHHAASGAILHVADPDPASAGQASPDRRWQVRDRAGRGGNETGRDEEVGQRDWVGRRGGGSETGRGEEVGATRLDGTKMWDNDPGRDEEVGQRDRAGRRPLTRVVLFPLLLPATERLSATQALRERDRRHDARAPRS